MSYNTEPVYIENEDHSMTLVRWSRAEGIAQVPSHIAGKPVTRIAPLAFAPFHMPEEAFAAGFAAPFSFNMFIIMSGAKMTHEVKDEGGPSEVALPETIRHIGEYAFWHCRNLKRINIPEGVEAIPAGCFGECVNLIWVSLPASLKAIGMCDLKALEDGRPDDCIQSAMLRSMPDVGAFYACHGLKKLSLPQSFRILGPHTFNSCGIEKLQLCKEKADEAAAAPGTGASEDSSDTAARDTSPYSVADNAFDHAVSLQWMDRTDRRGVVIYRIGLPAARDKILLADRKFGRLAHIPKDFFFEEVGYFDSLAQEVFRLDFSARMALGRLRYDEKLLPENRQWYLRLLIDHFAQAPQFMPSNEKFKDAYEALFDALMKSGGLTAADVSSLIRAAGEEHLSSGLINEMMRVRTENYSLATGFEDLDI